MESLKSITFLNLSQYLNFLWKNYLDDASQALIELFKKEDLSLLKFFTHLSEDEIVQLSKSNFESYVKVIIDEKIIEDTYQRMERWKADELEQIPQNQIHLNDLNIINCSRKKVFLKFLPKYTNDPELIIQIAQEIEDIHCRINEIQINTYLEIHDKLTKGLNANLREYQEELQVINEELQESYEEVQATNEELREQIEIRRTIEEALENERNYLSTILSNIKDAIVVCDENGILSYFNDATRKLHGIKEAALQPDDWAKYYNLYDAEGKNLLKKEDIPLYKAYTGKKVENEEMVIKTNDGAVKNVIANGERIISSDGDILGALVVMHDVTERKAMAEKQADIKAREAVAAEAKRQKEILENFFYNAPVPICSLKGPDHKYTMINKEYKDNFIGDKDCINKTIEEIFPELKGSMVFKILDDVYQTGERFVGNEVPVEFDRGKGFLEKGYFTFIYEPTYSVEGEVDGIIILAYEVTDIINSKLKFKELSDELAASNEELTAANEEIQASLEDLSRANQQLSMINADLDNFIYTASHDLKAPIANIEGLMKVLVRQLSSESKEGVGQIIEFIEASIDRFKNTLRNLTQVVKIQKEEHLEESLNVNEVVNEIKMDLQLLIEESRAIVETTDCSGCEIQFSEKNFKSIMYNLISNAIKYSSPDRHPHVKVSCEKNSEYFVITVEDNGLGMDLNDDPKIFSMFKRLHNHVEGTGIGLYIVKKIIENSGGKIEVTSKLDEGSIFKVYLRKN